MEAEEVGSRVFYKKFTIQNSLEIGDGIEYLTSRFEFENSLPCKLFFQPSHASI